MAFASGTPSDSIAFLNAFKAWYSRKKSGQLKHPKDELSWASENFIQIKRIREVAELYEDLKKRVSQFNMNISKETDCSDYTNTHKQKFILQIVIAGAYYPNFFFQREIDDNMATKDLCGFNPRTTVMVRNLPPYGFLYYKQLQSLFRLCGQVKAISFEHSRAYVEFCKTSRDSGVLPEVFLALLMEKQRVPLELSVYPTEQIESCAPNRPMTHMKFTRVKADIQSQTVSPLEVLSSRTNPDKLPPSRYFTVIITEVVEVGHFWGFPSDEANMKKQRLLTGDINERTLNPLTVSLYPNLLCLAPYAENHEQSLYYRARILHIYGSNVEVFFLDFGNTETVPSSSLRELPSDLLSQPFQAKEFQVAKMRPSAQSMILGNLWSSQARERFKLLLMDQSIILSLYSVLYDVMRVELFICTELTKTNVVDILVKEGHAVRVEENFDSEQSHEAVMTLYKNIEKGSYVPNYVSSSWKEEKKEEKELIDSLLGYFSKSPQCTRTKALRVLLKGPTSSYEMKLQSLSQKTCYKTIYVDKASINYLALNENPHYKHQRMLVAGSVSVNFEGTRINLKDTSIMPDIPGLPGLVTMLFTPIMELRTDEERTCYTGALCGLGSNSQTQAILPENDIELTFDVKFDDEDITEINALRVAINHMLCSRRGSMRQQGLDKISQMQEDCRDRLTRLFMRSPPREAVSPLYYQNPGQWDQVDPSLKINVTEPRGGNSRALFHLHSLILINH